MKRYILACTTALLLVSTAAQAQEAECLPNESVWLEMDRQLRLDQMPIARLSITDQDGNITGRLDIIQQEGSGDWWALERGDMKTCIRWRGVVWEPTVVGP